MLHQVMALFCCQPMSLTEDKFKEIVGPAEQLVISCLDPYGDNVGFIKHCLKGILKVSVSSNSRKCTVY